MWRYVFFAVLVGDLLSNASLAAIGVTSTRVPTFGLPGLITETLTATAPAGEKLIGFDFVSASGNYGFFGPMKQVNPVGLPWVFDDLRVFGFVDIEPSQDSHFAVMSTDGIALLPSESATTLKAAFNYLSLGVADATNIWTFVQIVHSAPVEYRGTLTVRDALGVDRLEYISGVLPAVSEPASGALAAIAVGFASSYARRNRKGRGLSAAHC